MNEIPSKNTVTKERTADVQKMMQYDLSVTEYVVSVCNSVCMAGWVGVGVCVGVWMCGVGVGVGVCLCVCERERERESLLPSIEEEGGPLHIVIDTLVVQSLKLS